MPNLLLVDDDKEVLKINAKYFLQAGYDVKAATNARNAYKILKDFTPDCIVLDVMMPGTDGFKACTEIRQLSQAPVIFLTGCDSEDDKIQGLMLGADDYMIKPYSLRELAARIQVLIRRYQRTSTVSSSVLEYPPLRLELTARKAYYENTEIPLTNKEYDLLHLLAASPNTVFSFEDIGNAVWGQYIESDRKTIMVTVNRLRKKLNAYPAISNCLETVWSKGYQFIAK